jgi:hypothetical protein
MIFSEKIIITDALFIFKATVCSIQQNRPNSLISFLKYCELQQCDVYRRHHNDYSRKKKHSKKIKHS